MLSKLIKSRDYMRDRKKYPSIWERIWTYWLRTDVGLQNLIGLIDMRWIFVLIYLSCFVWHPCSEHSTEVFLFTHICICILESHINVLYWIIAGCVSLPSPIIIHMYHSHIKAIVLYFFNKFYLSDPDSLSVGLCTFIFT